MLFMVQAGFEPAPLGASTIMRDDELSCDPMLIYSHTTPLASVAVPPKSKGCRPSVEVIMDLKKTPTINVGSV